MTEQPQTAAGRALLELFFEDGGFPPDPAALILAIEAEATDQAMLDAFDDVQRMDRAEAATPDPVASPPEAVRLLVEIINRIDYINGPDGVELYEQARRYLAATEEGT